MSDLFEPEPANEPTLSAPLAERMRPRRLDELVGQAELLGPHTPLSRSIARGELPSMILWGPPGCGKTTLAACLATAIGARLFAFSAVRVGVKELKAAMDEAGRLARHSGRRPVLFLDEIHRFNKAQQDALLPHVERGDLILIGATTENPSFEVNAALLSRARIVVLQALDAEAIERLLERALESPHGLADRYALAGEDLRWLAERSGGDARFALSSLELAAHATTVEASERATITRSTLEQVLAQAHLLYDRAGEEHFNVISAFQKSIRNSDAQAAIYWLARMLEAGEDPLYVARRLLRIASEDVGLADPAALLQCVAAAQTVHLLGMPECALALAQACIYCAQAPKSNRLETAYDAARAAIAEGHRSPVPLHLRNAVSREMARLGYGEGYLYAHDDPSGVAPMHCLPDDLRDRIFYRPSDRGFEAKAAERLREAYRLARRETSGKRKGPAESAEP